MTREELENAIGDITDNVSSGRVTDQDADAQILALFDRFERGLWTPCATPPVGGRDVVVWDSGPNYPRIMYYYKNEWHDTGVPVVLSHDAVWRELPAPPKE